MTVKDVMTKSSAWGSEALGHNLHPTIGGLLLARHLAKGAKPGPDQDINMVLRALGGFTAGSLGTRALLNSVGSNRAEAELSKTDPEDSRELYDRSRKQGIKNILIPSQAAKNTVIRRRLEPRA